MTAPLYAVCLVTHVVAPWDGQGRVCYELATHLADRGHSVTLVASTIDSRLLERRAIRWQPVLVDRRLPDPIQWSLFALGARRFLTESTRRSFDIVHLNGAIAPVAADVNSSHFVHAAWRRQAPAGRSIYQRSVTSTCAALERRAYRSAKRVVAVSRLIRDELVTDVGLSTEPVVIHNGVDSREFRPRPRGGPTPQRETVGIPADTLVVGFVGDARSPRKNLDLALEALARADEHVHLVVIGDFRGGPYPEMAHRMGLAGRTHFLGSRIDVADWLREFDVVICASHYEPASLVVLEAMASGAAVIAAPNVGNATFIQDRENGFLLKSPTDVETAAAILRRLASDRSDLVRIGRAARQTTLMLTWDRMAREYEALYHSIREERPPLSLVPLPQIRLATVATQ